jgi:hypothetical protein
MRHLGLERIGRKRRRRTRGRRRGRRGLGRSKRRRAAAERQHRACQSEYEPPHHHLPAFCGSQRPRAGCWSRRGRPSTAPRASASINSKSPVMAVFPSPRNGALRRPPAMPTNAKRSVHRLHLHNSAMMGCREPADGYAAANVGSLTASAAQACRSAPRSGAEHRRKARLHAGVGRRS